MRYRTNRQQTLLYRRFLTLFRPPPRYQGTRQTSCAKHNIFCFCYFPNAADTEMLCDGVQAGARLTTLRKCSAPISLACSPLTPMREQQIAVRSYQCKTSPTMQGWGSTMQTLSGTQPHNARLLKRSLNCPSFPTRHAPCSTTPHKEPTFRANEDHTPK